MAIRTVKHALVRIPHGSEDGQHPDLYLGETYHYAYQGESVDLRKEQEDILDDQGALYSAGEAQELGLVEPEEGVSSDDDERLDKFIHRTSVDKILEDVDGDPISADRVRASEQRVHGRKPRAKLIEQLTALVDGDPKDGDTEPYPEIPNTSDEAPEG